MGVLFTLPRDLVHRLADQALVLLGLQIGDDYGVEFPRQASEVAQLGLLQGPPALLRVSKPLDHRVVATSLKPGGHVLREVRPGRRVGVHIVGNVQPLRPGPLDGSDHVLAGTVCSWVDDRHVRVLDGETRATPDLDGLLHCLDVVPGPEPSVGDVKGVFEPGGGLGQGGDLVGVAEHGRPDRQAGREAERALLDGFGHEPAHLSKLVLRGSAVLGQPDSFADRRVADLWRYVDADAVGVHPVGPAVEVCPVLDDGRPRRQFHCPDWSGPHRERRLPAVAGDLGRDALVGLALAARVVQQREVGVRVHVDKARGDDEPGCVDDPGGLGVFELADRRYLAAADPQVGFVAQPTGAVDHHSISYERIEHVGPPVQFAGWRVYASRQSLSIGKRRPAG